jgi:pimeloyl-ACP methyl ester carboxylesterase
VRAVVLVDVLPGLKGERSQHIIDFVNGPPTFASFDELLDFTVQFNPTRSRSSLRRGILHNAEQQDDGTWVWRWARHRAEEVPLTAGPSAGAGAAGGVEVGDALFEGLWEAVAALTVPLLLVRGMRPDSVLGDEDEEELRQRSPSARIVHVEEAGHSVQGDRPLELVALIEDFVFGS